MPAATLSRFLLPALLALPLMGTAQNTDLNRDKNGNFNYGYTVPPPESGQVQGSPFLVAAWVPATVLLVGNSRPVPTPLKYDTYHQELRVRRPVGDSVIVPLGRVREFTLTGPVRRFVCYPPATLPSEVAGACAEILADGAHVQLLKFWQKVLVKHSTEAVGYATSSGADVLEDQTHYYLRWPADGHLTALRLKRASLEQALTGQPAALAALKARKGSLSSEADMVAALAALDPTLAR